MHMCGLCICIFILYIYLHYTNIHICVQSSCALPDLGDFTDPAPVRDGKRAAFNPCWLMMVAYRRHFNRD